MNEINHKYNGDNYISQCCLYPDTKEKHIFTWHDTNSGDLPPEDLPCNCGKKKIKYKVIVIDRNSY